LLPENLGAIGCKKFRLAGKVASQLFSAVLLILRRVARTSRAVQSCQVTQKRRFFRSKRGSLSRANVSHERTKADAGGSG
jgi:hypothetical protein